MEKLDKYFNTSDESFNEDAQSLYFQFSGGKHPITNKTFEEFISIVHEAYFFIVDNKKNPFTCINKLNELFLINSFNEDEKIYLLDGIMHTVINANLEDFKPFQIVFMQILDFRHENRTVFDDELMEMCEKSKKYEIENIKKDLQGKTPLQKYDYLNLILFDAKSETDEYTIGYIEHTELLFFLSNEIERALFEISLTPPAPKPAFDIKHNLPTIDSTKFDAKWLFDTYNNVVFKCSEECFNAWLVNGMQHPETINFILTGRKGKGGKPTLAIAQLRKFIETITGDAENTKDTYYKTVFGLHIKTAQNDTATNLNNTFKELKKKIVELKGIK